MMLADILVGRDAIDRELQRVIDERTTHWGVRVSSVEIRYIIIPQELEDAMSRQAQAERVAGAGDLGRPGQDDRDARCQGRVGRRQS